MAVPGTGQLGWAFVPVAVVLVGVPALDTTLVVSRLRRGAGASKADAITCTTGCARSWDRPAAVAGAGPRRFSPPPALVGTDKWVAAFVAILILGGIAVVVLEFAGHGLHPVVGLTQSAVSKQRPCGSSGAPARPAGHHLLNMGGRLTSPPVSGRRFDWIATVRRWSMAALPRARSRSPSWPRRRARRCASCRAAAAGRSPLRHRRWRSWSVWCGPSGCTWSTRTAKAGFLGRQAALSSGPAGGGSDYHGHVLEGYFGSAKSAASTSDGARLARGQSLPDRGQPRWLTISSASGVSCSCQVQGPAPRARPRPPRRAPASCGSNRGRGWSGAFLSSSVASSRSSASTRRPWHGRGVRSAPARRRRRGTPAARAAELGIAASATGASFVRCCRV